MTRGRALIIATVLACSSAAGAAAWKGPGDYLIFGHGFGEESIFGGPYATADACKSDAHALNRRLKPEYAKDDTTVFFCEQLDGNDRDITDLSDAEQQSIEQNYLNPE